MIFLSLGVPYFGVRGVEGIWAGGESSVAGNGEWTGCLIVLTWLNDQFYY